jgi:tetratricopeptide (TPR) repeat protein
MYWVALMFWEQKLLSDVPFMNRIFNVREKRRQARILYLIGALYFARADQFKAYSSFFCQLAVEHFRSALIADPSWGLPYLYLANLYSFKAQDKESELQVLLANLEGDHMWPRPTPLLSRPFQDAEELRHTYRLYENKLLDEAFNLYDKALGIAKRKGQKCTQARIIIAKALAELTSGLNTNDEGRIGKATQEIEDMKTRIDPADFDPARADCAGYLSNLATWYQIAYDKFVGVPNAKKEARRYLAYSLARSRSLWDTVENDKNFKSMRDEEDLGVLKEELDKKLREEREMEKKLGKKLIEERKLATMKGQNFRTEINKILEKVDRTLGRQST